MKIKRKISSTSFGQSSTLRGFLAWLAFSAFYCSGGELLQNGDFADGLKPWTINGGTERIKGNVTSDGPGGKPALEIEVLQAGQNDWDASFYQKMSFEKDHSYKVSFWAKADKEFPVRVYFRQMDKPYTKVFEKVFNITTEWKEYTSSFSSSLAEPSGVISMRVGRETGKLWFSFFSVKDGADAASSTPTASNAPIKPTNTASTQPASSDGSESGKITQIDPKSQTVTILNQRSKSSETYQVQKETVINLNGAKAVFGDLKSGMQVKVYPGADPLNADKISASR